MSKPEPTFEEQFQEQLAYWRLNPEAFAREIFGFKPSNQQKAFFRELGKLVDAKMKRDQNRPTTPEEEQYIAKRGISIRSGKGCHAAGTEILMWDGSIKKVEDIRVGDTLVGDDGTPRCVMALAFGQEKFYRLRYAWGDYYDVNENHILSLRCAGNHHSQHVKGTQIDVTVKEYLTWPKWVKNLYPMYKTGVSHWTSQAQKIPPYILGVWLGDGCKNGAQFACTDEEILREIEEYGKTQGLLLRNHSYKDHKLSGGNRGGKANPVLDALRELNLWRNKHIPKEYLIADEHDRLELLAGLIDTDGWVDKRKAGAQYGFAQKSEPLALQVQFLARSLGFHCTLRKVQKSWTYNGVKNTDTYCQLNISRGNVARIPCRVERKWVDSTNCKELNFMFTVEEQPTQYFYGFSLTGNGRFLGADFTVLHNTGKDAAAAIVAFWFLFCFPQSKSYLLAPSLENLKSNLVAEMSLWRARKIQGEPTCLIKDELDLMTTGCRLVNDEDHGKHWFITCNSAGPQMPEDQQLEVLSGKHARFMQFIIDEASGVPDAVFKPLDTTLTDPVNFIILLWNPTRRSGFAYRTHFDPNEKKHWINIHWNSEESDMITPDQIIYLREKYGVDSNQYRVSVLGEPPSIDDGSLIPYEWCTDAKELELTPSPKDPIIMGVDVARMGKDSSVILVRRGPQIIELTELNQLDTVALARWVAMRAGDHLPQAIYVDAVGLGIGVVDELNRMGVANVYAVNVSRAASNPRKFCLLRDELWWTLREKFERHGISLRHLPDATDLIAELSTVKYDVKDNGKIKVESKQDMRQRNVPSPNKADALMLTMMSNDADYYGTEDEDKELDSDHRNHVQSYRKLSWLEV